MMSATIAAAAMRGRRPLLGRGAAAGSTHRVSANRLGDVLDAMAAERTVIEIELVPDLVVDGLRNADRAGLGERLEPGGDVDAVAKDVVAVDDHIAEIDPDPQLETALGRERGR